MNKLPRVFTKKQMKNWRAYEAVRKSGEWNMFDHHAMTASGLTDDEYSFVMNNFAAMKEFESNS